MAMDAVMASGMVRMLRALGFDPDALVKQFGEFMAGIKAGVDTMEARIAAIERDQRAIREMLAILLADREPPAMTRAERRIEDGG